MSYFHGWKVKKKKAPTCTKDGYELKRCKLCGKERTEILDATGHKWGKAKNKTQTCKVCKKKRTVKVKKK